MPDPVGCEGRELAPGLVDAVEQVGHSPGSAPTNPNLQRTPQVLDVVQLRTIGWERTCVRLNRSTTECRQLKLDQLGGFDI